MTVPVIDIAPCLQGGNRDKHEVARQILAACEELGLFYLAGHGVSVGLVAAARQAAVDFFALPTAQKRLVLRDANRPVRGYFPLDDDSLPDADRAALPNLLEAYVMGLPDVPDDPWYRGKRARFFYAENLYPARPEGFRETVDEYFHALKKLTGLLVKAMALALGHSESFFADRVDRPACLMRLVRYPAQTRPPRGRRMRIGAHTDIGTLSIVRGDDVPGTLQADLPGAGWTDLHPPADAFVCNLGDTMSRWSGGRWKSPLHRVANPPEGAVPQDRMSLVFFHQPNYDVLLREIEGVS